MLTSRLLPCVHCYVGFTEYIRERDSIELYVPACVYHDHSRPSKIMWRPAFTVNETSVKVFTSLCVFQLTYSSSGVPVHDVTTAVTCSPPLTTHPSHLHEALVTSTPLPHTLTVVCTATSVPSERHVTLTTTYTSSRGVLQYMCRL